MLRGFKLKRWCRTCTDTQVRHTHTQWMKPGIRCQKFVKYKWILHFFFFFFSVLFCRFICYWIAWYAEFCENTSGLLHQRLWSLLFFFWHPTLEAAFPRETGHVPLQTPKIEVKLSVYSLSVDNCFFHFFVYKCFEYYCWVVLHPRYGEQCAIGGILKTKKNLFCFIWQTWSIILFFVLCYLLYILLHPTQMPKDIWGTNVDLKDCCRFFGNNVTCYTRHHPAK